MIYKNNVDLILQENNFRISNVGGKSGVTIIIHLISSSGKGLSHGPRMKVIFNGDCNAYFEINQNNGSISAKKPNDISSNEYSRLYDIIEDIAYGCYRPITAFFYNGSYKRELEQAISDIGGAKKSLRKQIAKKYRERFKDIVYEK